MNSKVTATVLALGLAATATAQYEPVISAVEQSMATTPMQLVEPNAWLQGLNGVPINIDMAQLTAIERELLEREAKLNEQKFMEAKRMDETFHMAGFDLWTRGQELQDGKTLEALEVKDLNVETEAEAEDADAGVEEEEAMHGSGKKIHAPRGSVKSRVAPRMAAASTTLELKELPVQQQQYFVPLTKNHVENVEQPIEQLVTQPYHQRVLRQPVPQVQPYNTRVIQPVMQQTVQPMLSSTVETIKPAEQNFLAPIQNADVTLAPRVESHTAALQTSAPRVVGKKSHGDSAEAKHSQPEAFQSESEDKPVSEQSDEDPVSEQRQEQPISEHSEDQPMSEQSEEDPVSEPRTASQEPVSEQRVGDAEQEREAKMEESEESEESESESESASERMTSV